MNEEKEESKGPHKPQLTNEAKEAIADFLAELTVAEREQSGRHKRMR